MHAHARRNARTRRLGNAEGHGTMNNVIKTREADAAQPIDSALNFIERIHLYAVSQVPDHATRVWLIYKSATLQKPQGHFAMRSYKSRSTTANKYVYISTLIYIYKTSQHKHKTNCVKVMHIGNQTAAVTRA